MNIVNIVNTDNTIVNIKIVLYNLNYDIIIIQTVLQLLYLYKYMIKTILENYFRNVLIHLFFF